MVVDYVAPDENFGSSSGLRERGGSHSVAYAKESDERARICYGVPTTEPHIEGEAKC